MRKALLASIGTLSAFGLAPAQASSPIEALRQIEAKVREQIAPDTPGLAFGIVDDGETVLEVYGGLAEMENKVPVGPASRFNIASNAKQFTALAALDLQKRGLLDFDDEVATAVSGLPSAGTPIRVRDLIVHASGLRDIYDLWNLQGVTWWQTFVDNDDALALLRRQRALNFTPGGEYQYSNSNYIVLAELLAARAKTSFVDLTAALFDRYGMASTRFVESEMALIPGRARPYGNFGDWVEYPSVTTLRGDGFLFTTLSDQLRWERAVQSAPRDPLVAASQELLATSSVKSYGFGLEHGLYKGLRHVFHDGSTGAYSASLSRFPEQRISIVAMSNNGKVSTRALVNAAADILLADRIRQTPFPERPAVIADRPAESEIVGVYYQPSGGNPIRIVARDGALFREIEGVAPVELKHETGNLFAYKSNPKLRMAFEQDQNGARMLTIYLSSQRPSTARMVPAPANLNVAVRCTAGTYVNPETGASLELVLDGETFARKRRNGKLQAAALFGRGVLQFGQDIYRFDPAPDGDVRQLRLTGGRLRDVVFEKTSKPGC